MTPATFTYNPSDPPRHPRSFTDASGQTTGACLGVSPK
jgi:hypothetical protein